MCGDGGLILITYGEKKITHVHLTHVIWYMLVTYVRITHVSAIFDKCATK